MRTIKIITILLLLVTSCNEAKQTDKNLTPHVESFIISKCIENCKDPEKTIFKKYSDNSLDLKIGKILGCLDSIPSIKSNLDTLFISIQPPANEDVACYCYFKIEIKIKDLSFDPSIILINGRQVGDMKNH